ncbi:MAG: superoxide dismutase [Bacilli bacterium]
MEYKRITLDYNSLEPYIDNKTLDLHYNAHYKNYTEKLNKYLKEQNYNYKYTPTYLAKNIDIFPKENRDEILYNLGGYLNHNLYFYNLTDKKKEVPIKFNELINKYFTSFNNFKEEFINTANELKGSGYTFLVLDKNNNLRIINMSNQDTPYYYGFIPIMTIDVWEHSYYLKYNNKRNDYLTQTFNIIDFDKVYNLYIIATSQ